MSQGTASAAPGGPPPPPPPPPPPVKAVDKEPTPDSAAEEIPRALKPRVTKSKVLLTAKEIAALPNFQDKYNDKIPLLRASAAAAEIPTDGTGGNNALASNTGAEPAPKNHILCVRNPRTGSLTAFFKYYPAFAGFLGPREPMEDESGACALEWVHQSKGEEILYCTPFLLFDYM